jgi:hypothetical protein
MPRGIQAGLSISRLLVVMFPGVISPGLGRSANHRRSAQVPQAKVREKLSRDFRFANIGFRCGIGKVKSGQR